MMNTDHGTLTKLRGEERNEAEQHGNERFMMGGGGGGNM